MKTGRTAGTAVDRPGRGGPYPPNLLPNPRADFPAAPRPPVKPGTPIQLPPAQQGPVPGEFCPFLSLLFFGHGVLAGTGLKSGAGPRTAGWAEESSWAEEIGWAEANR